MPYLAILDIVFINMKHMVDKKMQAIYSLATNAFIFVTCVLCCFRRVSKKQLNMCMSLRVI